MTKSIAKKVICLDEKKFHRNWQLAYAHTEYFHLKLCSKIVNHSDVKLCLKKYSVKPEHVWKEPTKTSVSEKMSHIYCQLLTLFVYIHKSKNQPKVKFMAPSLIAALAKMTFYEFRRRLFWHCFGRSCIFQCLTDTWDSFIGPFSAWSFKLSLALWGASGSSFSTTYKNPEWQKYCKKINNSVKVKQRAFKWCDCEYEKHCKLLRLTF